MDIGLRYLKDTLDTLDRNTFIPFFISLVAPPSTHAVDYATGQHNGHNKAYGSHGRFRYAQRLWPRHGRRLDRRTGEEM
jgi:hypothetical protein